jgi:glycine/D-amino acid oxidase-like deaminating enzyme
MIRSAPRVLLIDGGPGQPARLAAWTRLAAEGDVELAGVVVTGHDAAETVRATIDVPVHAHLTDALLTEVDAVDIASPAAQRANLVRRCLPFAHVRVAWPIPEAETLTAFAGACRRVLVEGQPPRRHPLCLALKQLTAALPERPRGILGTSGGPMTNQAEASVELQHLLGIVDFLFEVESEIAMTRRRGTQTQVSVRYPGPMLAVYRMGAIARDATRTLDLLYSDRRVTADLVDNAIVVATRNNQLRKQFFTQDAGSLVDDLRLFAATLRESTGGLAPVLPTERPAPGVRIPRAAHGAARPRIAVVGGGIFGATCALELAQIADVTLFERRGDLLGETSDTNQRRHHSGFHYPRSYDTITEIRAAKASFEETFGAAIDRSFPAYYCTSASGVEIPAERYLAACQSNGLPFTITDPPAGIVDAALVSLCLLTDEGVYDTVRLRRILRERLHRAGTVRTELLTDVVSGRITSDGVKRLAVSGPGGAREEAFDYLVNATYAQRNLVSQWFGFPVEPLRFDLYEILEMRLPIPQVSVTVLDAPFTTLTGTGHEDRFLLSHIHDSVSCSVIPDDGMPPAWPEATSNRANMIRHCAKYLPILEHATDVRSVWMTRAVNAFARDFDARPTVISDHGFGCWSVLGGKVVTCVANAREIAREVLAEQGGALAAPAAVTDASGGSLPSF